MSIEFRVRGAPVAVTKWNINHEADGSTSSGIEFGGGFKPRPGDDLVITYDGKPDFVGPITAVTLNSDGTGSAIAWDTTTMIRRHTITYPAPPPPTETEFQYGDVVRWKRRDTTSTSFRYMVIRQTNTGWYAMIPIDKGWPATPTDLWGDNFERVP